MPYFSSVPHSWCPIFLWCLSKLRHPYISWMPLLWTLDYRVLDSQQAHFGSVVMASQLSHGRGIRCSWLVQILKFELPATLLWRCLCCDWLCLLEVWICACVFPTINELARHSLQQYLTKTRYVTGCPVLYNLRAKSTNFTCTGTSMTSFSAIYPKKTKTLMIYRVIHK